MPQGFVCGGDHGVEYVCLAQQLLSWCDSVTAAAIGVCVCHCASSYCGLVGDKPFH